MNYIISALIFLNASLAMAKDCIPAVEKIPKSDYSYGMYNRIHPSGDYVLETQDNNAVIYKISERNSQGNIVAQKINTPLNLEAYPVENARGEWSLISSPQGYSGGVREMQYHRFSDILANADNPSSSKPVFTDPEHSQWYQSTAELPDSTKTEMHIRTILYHGSGRDYKAKIGADGKLVSLEKSAIYNLCENVTSPGDTNAARISELRARKTALNTQLQNLGDRYYETSGAERDRIYTEYQTISAQRNVVADELYSLAGDASSEIRNPVVSKDGTRMAGIWGGTLKIFKIGENAKDCQIIADTGYRGSKVSFSYPVKGKEPLITFAASSGPSGGYDYGIIIFDPNSKTSKQVATGGYYPGFTRDGRIIYASYNGDFNGFVKVDPNQVGGSTANCITTADVQKAAVPADESGANK